MLGLVSIFSILLKVVCKNEMFIFKNRHSIKTYGPWAQNDTVNIWSHYPTVHERKMTPVNIWYYYKLKCIFFKFVNLFLQQGRFDKFHKVDKVLKNCEKSL